MSCPEPLSHAVIFVRDTAASLRLYRDTFGMEVIETRDIGGPAVARLYGLEDCRIRVTCLSAEDSRFGRLALLDVSGATLPELPAPRIGGIQLGQNILVFDCPDMATIQRSVKAANYPTMREPTTIPASKGGKVHEYIFFDPDGVAIDLIHLEPDPGQAVVDFIGRVGMQRPGSRNRTSPLLRMSIVVRDTARSLGLYRDILGLTVIDQRQVTRAGKLLGVGDCTIDVTYLAAQDSRLGLIGLFDVRDVPVPELSRPSTRSICKGQAAVVMGVSGIREIHAALERGGATILCPPTTAQTLHGQATEMTFFDPDGTVVHLTEARDR